MEFNAIDEENKFKLGQIITVFKTDESDREIALFSLGEYDGDNNNLFVAYIAKGSNGYDYLYDIEDENELKSAMEAAKEIVLKITKSKS